MPPEEYAAVDAERLFAAVSRFTNRNLPEKLADHIVLLVATGNLQPGDRLYEKEMCELLGVSRVPVREALRILQAQGLVKTIPNRGSYITSFGPEEIRELMELRLKVEQIAVQRLSDNTDRIPEVIRELENSIEDMNRAAKLDDSLAFCYADLAFHNRLVEHSMSPVLKPAWEALSRGVLLFIVKERRALIDYRSSIRDHQLIVELIRGQNWKGMDKEMRQHILGKFDQVDENF